MYNYYSAIKKNDVMPCAATWMQLEIIILTAVVRKRKTNIIRCQLYVDSNGTNEHIYKTETDSQT